MFAAGALTLALALAGCSSSTGEDSATDASSAPAEEPRLEFTGPNGEVPGALSELELTDDEIAKVNEGSYTSAFVWHTSSEFVTAVEKGATDEFDDLGIEIVASTQAGFDAATQANNLQTVLALKPDIIVATAVDPVSDTIGKQFWDFALEPGPADPPDGEFSKRAYFRSDVRRAERLVELVERGYTDQLFVSLDLTGAEVYLNPATHGQWGYAYLAGGFLPLAASMGLRDKDREKLLRQNPLRLLTQDSQ